MSFTTRQGRAFYKRPLAVLGATALTVGAFGPAAQADSHVQSITPACEGWTDPFGFEDIQGESQAYQDAINCLAWYKITEGRNPTTYAPDADVKRYEMALFISRTIGYIEKSSDIDVVDPEDADDAGFEDIDGLNGEQKDAIAQLVELKIVEGKNADEFAPYESITRRDMARFIDRLVDNVVDGSEDADFYEADYTDLFVDVPADLPGAEDIYSLRAEGIVQGESGNRYLPYASVDRKDMAFFVMRTVADLIEKEYIDALTEEEPAPAAVVLDQEGGVVVAGEPITGTITGDNIEAVTVAGDCVTAGEVIDADEAATGIQFSVPTNADAEGACVVAFTVSFTDDREDQVVEVEITVEQPAPVTNQDFAVTSDEAGVVPEGSEVNYTATGIEGDEVTISLADAGNLTTVDGIVSFEADKDGQADFGDVSAQIIAVNGVFRSEPSDTWTGAPAADGTVTFTVRGKKDFEESVVPVVFVDADTVNDGLDLDADGLPTEDFGIGDVTTFATVDAIELDQATDFRQFGTPHTVTAQLVTDTLDDDENFNAAPYAGETIVFEIKRTYYDADGDPTGTQTIVRTATTDADGSAALTYTVEDPNEAEGDTATDEILAWWDEDGDGIRDAGEDTESAAVSVDWTDEEAAAAAVTAEASAEFAPVGSTQSVTAEVTDQFGNPVAGETVTFKLGGTSYKRPTNADGVATFRYTGPSAPREDTIDIAVGEGEGAISLEAPVTITWYAAAADDVTNADVLGADTTANLAFVEVTEDESSPPTFVAVNYGTGDLFYVDDTPVTAARFEERLVAALRGDQPPTLTTRGYDEPGSDTTIILNLAQEPVTEEGSEGN